MVLDMGVVVVIQCHQLLKSYTRCTFLTLCVHLTKLQQDVTTCMAPNLAQLIMLPVIPNTGLVELV